MLVDNIAPSQLLLAAEFGKFWLAFHKPRQKPEGS